MDKELLSIEEVARLLKISAKTLRRWEKRGIIVPQRTKGNQRRYTKEQIESLIKAKPKGNLTQKHIDNLQSEAQFISERSAPLVEEPMVTTIFTHKQRLMIGGSIGVLLLVVALGLVSKSPLGSLIGGLYKDNTPVEQLAKNTSGVLASETENTLFNLNVNVPTTFSDSVTFLKDITINGQTIFLGGINTQNGDIDAGTGEITASNVVYSLNAGTGLSVSGGQNPTITNTGVTSLEGLTGVLDLTAGTGITLDGLKITNSDTGSSQKIFKNIVVGSDTLSAGSNTDTLNISAGIGITLTTNTGTKTITISSSNGSGTSVTSLNSQTGDLVLAAGTGLSLSGLEFTNTGVTSVQGLAGGISLAAGSNVSLSTDTNTKTVTISSSQPAGAWTQNGNYVTLTDSDNYVGIGVDTPVSPLQVGGNILPGANAVYDLGSSDLMWNNIYANQLVGTGAQINLTVPATSSATGLSVSMTGSGSGQLASFSFNGTQVLGVGFNDVYIGGKVSMLTDAALANAKDVFVYDTTKDSGNGQWTNSDTAQSASWYNEEIDNTSLDCLVSSDNRCGQRPFPQKATIYVTATSVYIFDNKDNTLWMKFSQGLGFAINGTSVTLTSVYALNGVIYLGTTTNGLIEINFLKDKIFQFDYNGGSGGRSQFLGTIADRHSNKGYGSRQAWGEIASDQVNGVFVRVINGKVFIAASTLGGVSLINLSDQKVIKYVDN